MRDPSWRERAVSPADAVRLIESGMRVFVQGAAATPTPLLEALADRTDLEQVNIYHLHLGGPCRFAEPEHEGRFRSISFFVGPALRKPVAEGRADFMPVFLSDIPRLFKSGRVPLDAVLCQVSPPDKHGMCSLGTSVDAAKGATQSARVIIAEINERMPRTHGNTAISIEDIDAFICTNHALHQHPPAPETDVEVQIGETIAGLIEDGATLQMGIGAIPDAVLRRLDNKLELGVHTEMFSDGVVKLMENGVITNRQKTVHPGRTTSAFVMGTDRLYEFVDDNLAVELHPCDRTNDIQLIRKNPKVVAINSAIEVSLSGQVCADSMGYRIYSGIGGQMDFIHGAALSEGGRPIIALPSTAKGGTISRIAMTLKEGAGVVTTRGHVHWVVTEYGAVNLHGMTRRERATALISIAHPDFRPELEKSLKGVLHFG